MTLHGLHGLAVFCKLLSPALYNPFSGYGDWMSIILLNSFNLAVACRCCCAAAAPCVHGIACTTSARSDWRAGPLWANSCSSWLCLTHMLGFSWQSEWVFQAAECSRCHAAARTTASAAMWWHTQTAPSALGSRRPCATSGCTRSTCASTPPSAPGSSTVRRPLGASCLWCLRQPASAVARQHAPMQCRAQPDAACTNAGALLPARTRSCRAASACAAQQGRLNAGALAGEGAAAGEEPALVKIDLPLDGRGFVTIPASDTVSPILSMWLTLFLMYIGARLWRHALQRRQPCAES